MHHFTSLAILFLRWVPKKIRHQPQVTSMGGLSLVTKVQRREPVLSAAGRMFCDFVVCWQKNGVTTERKHVFNEVHVSEEIM